MHRYLTTFVVISTLLSLTLHAETTTYPDRHHSVSQQQQKDDTLTRLLRGGKLSAHLKLFHMVRTFDRTAPDTKALTGGGIIKYESGHRQGFSVALAYYGSHYIGSFYSREEGIRTSMLRDNGKDVRFLGEAYLNYSGGNTRFRIGRQRLSTPLMGDLYLRVLPTVYEAATIKNSDLPDTTLEAGYVKSYSHFGSAYSGFDTNHDSWGDRGLLYLYLNHAPMDALSFRGEYIKALSEKSENGTPIAMVDYRYADIRYPLPRYPDIYLKAQYGGNRYLHAPDSILTGAKIGAALSPAIDATLFYDKIRGNNFEVIMASPMFSDWQQGYGRYEPSHAVGTTLTVKPAEDLSVRFVYVAVHSDTQALVDDFSEFNFDLKYTINHWSKLRISYSAKNQSDASEELLRLGRGGREDRNDLRFIYTIDF